MAVNSMVAAFLLCAWPLVSAQAASGPTGPENGAPEISHGAAIPPPYSPNLSGPARLDLKIAELLRSSERNYLGAEASTLRELLPSSARAWEGMRDVLDARAIERLRKAPPEEAAALVAGIFGELRRRQAAEPKAVPAAVANAQFPEWRAGWNRLHSLDAMGEKHRRVISELWGRYEGEGDRTRGVRKPIVFSGRAGFFARTYALGQAWWLASPHGTQLAGDFVAESARQLFREYFAPKAPEAAEPFDDYLKRVSDLYGQGHAGRVYRLVSQALRQASLREPGRVGRYFDSLLSREEQEKLQRFRARNVPRVIDSFSDGVKRLIVRRMARRGGEPKAYNVAGVLLTGSYVTKTADERSDLDIAVVTWDGASRDVKDFMFALGEQGARRSLHDWNDWHRFRSIYPMSRELIESIYRNMPHLLISPHANAGRAAVSGSFWRPSAEDWTIYRALWPLASRIIEGFIRKGAFD